MDKATTNISMLGKAGELRVASELLLRGIEVYLNTLADSSADLVLANGKRIQVKAARLKPGGSTSRRGRKYKGYRWSFAQWHKSTGHVTKHSLDNVDYVVLWAIDDDTFLVLPADEARGTYSIRLTLNSKRHRKASRYARFVEAWDILEKEK